MTFNKAKEELKWKCWKDKEEKVLRKSGMEESSIEILRQMDWEDFNAERRYREHIAVNQEIVATGIQNEQEEVAKNIQDISDTCGCGNCHGRILVVLTPCGKKYYVL